MAIAFDASSNTTEVTGTSLTWAHTCTGDDRILFVNAGIPTADTITGVTYGGVAMTKIAAQVVDWEGNPDRYISLWYLIAPATGANNIVITSSNSQILRACAVSYTGAKQSSQPDAFAQSKSQVNASASITQAVTTVADNCWLVGAVKMQATPISAGANTTERVEDGEGDTGLYDSNGAKTPAGSYSLAVVNGSAGAQYMCIIVASFAPTSAGGGGFTPRRLLMGVGI